MEITWIEVRLIDQALIHTNRFLHRQVRIFNPLKVFRLYRLLKNNRSELIKVAILFKDKTGFHLISQYSGQGSQLDEQSLEELETTELGVRRNQLHPLNKAHRPKAPINPKLSLLSSCVSSNSYDLPPNALVEDRAHYRQTQNPNALVEDRAHYRQLKTRRKCHLLQTQVFLLTQLGIQRGTQAAISRSNPHIKMRTTNKTA